MGDPPAAPERERKRLRRISPDVEVVGLLTLAFLLLGVIISVLVPMFGNFDEQTHLDRAGYTARHGFEQPGPSLRVTYGSWEALKVVRGPTPLGADGPAQRETYRAFRDYPGGEAGDPTPCPGVCQNIQFAHPPTWYLLVAPVAKLLDAQPFPRVLLALRLLDVLIVAPMVALTWLIGREVWPRSRRRPLVAAAVVALFAPLAYCAANVNNDALILLLIAAGTALSARLLRRGADVRLAAALGLVVSIGLLTKIEMVLAAPALGLCVLAARGNRGTRLRSAVAFAILAAPGAAWWLDELGGGGPLTPDSSELLGAPVPGPWAHQPYLTYAAKKLPTLVGRVFGTFDAPVTFLQDPVRHALVLAVAVLAVGWLVLRRWRRPRVAELRIGLLAGVPLALALGTLYASVDGYRYTGQLRGLSPRYVYPGIPVLAIGAVAAIATIADRLRLRAWRPLAVIGVALLAAGAAATIARGVQGNFSSSSWPDILDRARAVSPIGRPAEVAVALGLAWVAVLTLAAGRLAGVARGAPNEPEPEPS